MPSFSGTGVALCHTVERTVLGPVRRMNHQAECAVESRAAPVAPVEAKGKFVEVGGKMVREYGTFVRSEEPPLQVADDEVDHRQIRAGLLAFRGLQDAPMCIAEVLQTVVDRCRLATRR